MFEGACAKSAYTPEKFPEGAGISQTKKQVARAKMIRPKIFHPPKTKRGSAHKKISKILGEDIYGHALVMGHAPTIEEIKNAQSIKEINKVLEKRYNQVHVKKISLPQGRDHYQKYYFENHPNWSEDRHIEFNDISFSEK